MAPRTPRPDFVSILLARPVPSVIPYAIGNKTTSSSIYMPDLVEKISELKCHPLVVSCLHTMNGDIKNARSILVKLPEEKGFFSWLSGYISALEGPNEMLKAKTSYAITPSSILISYFNISPSISPHLQTSHLLDHLSLLLDISPAEIRNATEKANLVPKEAWTELELVERKKIGGIGGETMQSRVERMRWEEVKGIFKVVETKLGWSKL